MLRSLDRLEEVIRSHKDSGDGDDGELTARLAVIEPGDGDGEGEEELDVVVSALADGFVSAMATALLGYERGDGELVAEARERLEVGMSCCAELNLVNQWWCPSTSDVSARRFVTASFHVRIPVVSAGRAPVPHGVS